MKVSYKPLWKLMIDRDVRQKELREAARVSSSTISKLKKNENVTTDVLLRICSVLKCDFKDIMECVED